MSMSAVRPKQGRASAVRKEEVPAAQVLIGLLVGAATCYTAVAAMAAAHGVPVGFGLVSAIEVLLLGGGGLLILYNGIQDDDGAVLSFLYFMVVLAVLLSIANERPLVETIRSALIICVFALLGQRANGRTLDMTFLGTAVIVLLVLILEVSSTSGYVWLFQPQRFYESTRGMGAAKYDTTGLFAATAGFAGRFSFGLFTDHRSSSIFLEQVGNANFACVLALYTVSRWQKLLIKWRALCVVTIVAILVTTNARFGSVLVVMLTAGYYLFGRLPRRLLPSVTIAIAIAVALVAAFRYDVIADTFVGRIATTVREFNEAGVRFFLGGDAAEGLQQMDSGYAYLVGTSSIFGLLALWIFVNYYPRANDAGSRRLNWGIVIYLLGQLTVSGTSVFSIKTAALLWMLVGFIRVQAKAGPLTGHVTGVQRW